MKSNLPGKVGVTLLITINMLLASSLASLADGSPDEIALWPKGAPGDQGNIGEEHDISKPNEGLVSGKPVIRLGNVSKPTITIHRPPADKANGAAVVVCPGGGYNILALDLEGTEVCDWLNSIGVTGILLKYRVPARAGRERYEAPLQDAQRALSIARSKAADWKLDPKRIGILGFSAGGHLSATASTGFEKRTYDSIDDADQSSSRPDFTILIYPAYLTPKDNHHTLSPELKVSTNTPPAFLVQTQDDGVGVWNAMAYASALQEAKVPVELHVYAKGGHGYGLRASKNPVTGWPALAEIWLRGRGLLQAP
jgi:acetyl esterase/lipase